MDPRTRMLLEAPVGSTIVKLALPNVVVMVVQASIGLIETYFVAKLGLDALAGMALVFPLFMLLQMVSAGAMGGGILSAIARALGSGNRDRAREHQRGIGCRRGERSVASAHQRVKLRPEQQRRNGRRRTQRDGDRNRVPDEIVRAILPP